MGKIGNNLEQVILREPKFMYLLIFLRMKEIDGQSNLLNGIVNLHMSNRSNFVDSYQIKGNLVQWYKKRLVFRSTIAIDVDC